MAKAVPTVAPAPASPAAFQALTPGGERKGWLTIPFVLVCLVFIFMGLLNFNAKLFLMGDDANYILDAYNFMHRHAYPRQSSLYGLILAAIIFLAGTNVVMLKCFSFLFAFTGFVTLYRICYKRVDNRILYPVLIYSAISSNMQFYTSSTLSEACYMMVQYLYTGYFFYFTDRLASGKDMRKHWILLGFAGLVMSLGKNVALIIPFAVVAYFLVYKQWRYAFKALGWYLLFKVPYEVMLYFIYKNNTGSSQIEQILVKDIYHYEAGHESLAGFGMRLVKNAQIYLGQVTMNELGITTQGWTTLIATLLVIFIVAAAMVFAYKRNRYIFFIGLYTVILSGVTFLALQPAVAQDRIIIVLVPYIFLLLFYGALTLADRFNAEHASVNRIGFYILLAYSGFVTLSKASATIQESLPVLQENLSGDLYYGYTQDCINYLEMGKWITEHIPEDQVVAVRKPNGISVYNKGRYFLGIYSCPNDKDSDQMLAALKEQKVSYMILASLRADPNVANPKNIITTLHRYCAKIIEKYPQAITIVHTIGTAEPCYLVKINYP